MNYGKINPIDIANGPGVRVSVFVSGCEHRCPGCFNPETWDFEYGKPFGMTQIVGVLNLGKPDYISGLSILGGEPLHPKNEHTALLCHAWKHVFPDKPIWVYTGYLWEDVKQLYFLKYVDVLVDGPFVADKKELTLKFRGSSNQRIIDVQKSLRRGTVVLWEDKS